MAKQLKTVLITGANRGIGFAIAKTLVQQGGFRVLLAARQQKDAEEAAALLGAGIALRLDLTDPLLVEQKALQIERSLDVFSKSTTLVLEPNKSNSMASLVRIV